SGQSQKPSLFLSTQSWPVASTHIFLLPGSAQSHMKLALKSTRQSHAPSLGSTSTQGWGTKHLPSVGLSGLSPVILHSVRSVTPSPSVSGLKGSVPMTASSASERPSRSVSTKDSPHSGRPVPLRSAKSLGSKDALVAPSGFPVVPPSIEAPSVATPASGA